MSTADELATLDATDQATLVRTGQATPLELVDAAIARIEAINPNVNAVIHERFERARAEATGPLPDGPLRGVPFLLKDLHTFSVGDPHHGGTSFLKSAGWVADRDDDVTTRLRATGVVFVGRTNSPELGTTITTEPFAHGPSRNPWNPQHSTGGSSGGSAAAVASRMVPAAHASDGGGSIRIPASECGLVGLKPSRGRVPLGPAISDSWAGSTVHGVVTRTVRDTAVLLDAMSGPMVGDFYRAAPLPGPLVDEVGREPGSLRIGVLDHPLLSGVTANAECATAVRSTADLLAGLGHRVEDSYPEVMADDAFIGAFTTIVAAHVAHDLVTWGRVIGRELGGEDVEPGNAMFSAIGRSIGAVDYLDAVYWQQAWVRRMSTWWRDESVGLDEGFDLLVTPVLNGTPPPLGHLIDPDEGLGRVTDLMQYTAQFNVTGQPALSLPLWWSADGLPVGIQFVAAVGREDLLVRLAAQLETARPWADRVPPVHA